jgi:hypothetical protein
MGCHAPLNTGFTWSAGQVGPNGARSSVPTLVTNPAQIPDHDSEFVWSQVVDTVDDYFQIDSEQRVIKTARQWMDGKLMTYPEIGATYLEPWRKDALRGFQRLQSSLQTVRRTAVVDVTPTTGGYSIAVTVNKDLEEVDRSLSASDGSASLRHDGTLVRTDPALLGSPITLSWIPLERDSDLEQRILREIVGRVSNVARPRQRLLHHR